MRLNLGDRLLLLCTDDSTDGIPSDERQRIWQQYHHNLDRLTALGKRVKKGDYYIMMMSLWWFVVVYVYNA